MIPLKLTLRGFLTYRDEESLDFENLRTAVIVGDNGHGKSALFDAITYALFGEHRGGKTRALVNQESRELAVRFEFEAGGRRYRMDRSLTLSERKNGIPDPSATGYIYDGRDWQAVAHGVTNCDAWVREVLGGMTYEICCQSILLCQGAQDRFLAAKPTERQMVLNTLLDFEPYRRLQNAARVRKNTAKSEADLHAARIGDLVPHDPDTLLRLETDLTTAGGTCEQAQQAVATARERFDASTRFRELTLSLDTIDAELANVKALVERANDVRTAAARRLDLEQAIPLLRAALGAQRAATTAEGRVHEARRQLGEIDLEKRGEEARHMRDLRETAEQRATEARECCTELSREREDLKPKGGALAQAEAEREAAGRHTATAGELETLALSEPAARAEADHLAAVKTAIPWLRQVRTARAALQDSERLISACNSEITTEESEVESDVEAVRVAQNAVDAATRLRQELIDALAGARLDVKNLQEQLDHRHEASAEQVCTHCGQMIDPDRVAREIETLLSRKSRADSGVARATEALAVAEVACRTAAAALENATTSQFSRKIHLTDLKGELRRAESDLASARNQFVAAIENLDDATAARIQADVSYPGAPEIDALQKEARGADAARQRAIDALEAATRRNHLLEEVHQALERADALEAQVPAVERVRVRERWAQIDGDLKLAEESWRIAEKALTTAQQNERAAQDALQTDERTSAGLESAINVNESTAKDQRAQADDLKQQIRGELQPEPLTEEAIAAFVIESANLEPMANLLDTVNAAPTVAAELQGQRAAVVADMARVADEDRRDPDVADAEWRAAGADLIQRQGQLRKAESDLQLARDAAAKARDLEAQMLAARTREEDARLLEGLLGVQKLQGKLVEAARIGITDAANRELDAISRGGLRLEMQRKVKKNGEEAELELLVLDRAAVREPIDAAYLSGSQRFRVAVALALGIGQYVGGAARGQRAVIIDEGFGSLDADGIDAMAEHLRDLSDRLDRVVLVTHQAAMRRHFSSGFLIRRKNGTSAIEPWNTAPGASARAQASGLVR